MQRLPEPLKEVVDRLAELPGVGPKSALRMALMLLKWPEDKARQMGQSIRDLRDQLCLCSLCGSLSDCEPCAICSEPTRMNRVLCVVSEWDSLLVLEEAGFFRGKYLVLGGLLSPLDGIDARNLAVDKLEERLKTGVVEEVVLALGTTLEAETTGSYIKNLLQSRYPQIQITRLAQGIPLGADIKFMDRETLRQSMEYRQQF